ncbi:MAG: Ig-like domain-containing protein [Candidatus Lloydbacteria bacterium]|nr:Ig-like domain-containing protein [Candidatus Lloydbacteria bacterium]
MQPAQNTRMFAKIALITLCAGGIILYAYYQMRDFLNGPSIVITEPSNGQTMREALVSVSGNAQRISGITLNDRKIFTDENGIFREKVALFPGYNEIEVSVKDRFNREETKLLTVVYK